MIVPNGLCVVAACPCEFTTVLGSVYRLRASTARCPTLADEPNGTADEWPLRL